MDRGYLNGTGDDELALTMDMIRVFTVVDKARGFENYTVDIMPEWAKLTIDKIKDKGYVSGTDDDELDLTKAMIRILVIMDNAGCFGD